MKTTRARLIYNPTSGREEVKRKLGLILQRLEKGGIETSCYATEGKGDATLAAADAVEKKFDIVIAAGGDGTLNEVVNGLSPYENRPALGILPLGTTNDFARAHRIPKNWIEACDLIIRKHCTAVDVGSADDRYFINIAAGGSLTELTYEVPSKLKTMVGQFAYYIKGLEKITHLKPTRLKIKAQNVGNYDEEFMLFLLANSNSIGGFDRILPDADPSDGKFDFLGLRKCNLAEFLRIVTMVMRGESIEEDPHFIQFQSSHIEIHSTERVQLNLDGEYGGVIPCSFQVLQGHLQLLTDEHGKTSYSKHRVNRALQL